MPPKKEKNKFSCFKVKAKGNTTRGSENAKQIVDAFEEAWDDLQELLDNNEEERNNMITYFNELIEGEDDLGAILYGDLQIFTDRCKFLEDTVAEEYTAELEAQGLIELEKK